MNVLRTATLGAIAILCATTSAKNASAAPTFANGDVITYSQVSWDTIAAGMLASKFDTVYSPFFAVEVGIPGTAGFSIRFTDPILVLAFFPEIGNLGPLGFDETNPTSSSSGGFGANVLALQLDVDFSDAGFTPGNVGIPFGDLVLANFGVVPDTFSALPLLNGLTVRQFLGNVNTLLGGGSGIYGIDNLTALTDHLTYSFDGGTVSKFAEDHLRISQTPNQIPEPAIGSLMLLSLLGVGLVRRRGWCSGPAAIA